MIIFMIKILITQEGEPTLITPCLCCGSLKFVHQVLLQSLTSNHPCLQRLLVFISSLSSTPHPRHQECLQRWIKSSDIKRCELCKFPFVMQSKVNHHHHHHFQMMIMTMIRSHRGEKSFQYPAIIKVSMPRLEMGKDLSAQLAGHENVFVRQFRNIILQLEGSEVKILSSCANVCSSFTLHTVYNAITGNTSKGGKCKTCKHIFQRKRINASSSTLIIIIIIIIMTR